ncbi:MAG: choice-of-anchor Q domain-containing protein [Spirosomataceae bacterium]
MKKSLPTLCSLSGNRAGIRQFLQHFLSFVRCSILLLFLLTAGLLKTYGQVTNGNDSGSGSLRDAIANAASGATIIFFGVTTVTLTSGELLINKDLTIDGGSGVTITRSGGAQFRIFNVSSGVTVSMNKLTITNGNHGSQAGGIQNSSTLTMTNCTVSGNTSPQAGGIENDGILTLTNCTLNNNTSSGVGGAIVSYGSATTLTNCTVNGNQSVSHGGGFHIVSGSLNVTNCTITGNNSSSGSGGGFYLGGNALLKNTIITANTASSLANIAGNNVSSSSSYNLFGSSSGGLVNGSNGNILSNSPQLDVLANNGGYTKTMALLANSPALDKGAAVSGVTTDQRGLTRPFDLPSIASATSGDDSDIGAYETQVTCNTVTLSPTSLSGGTIGVGYTKSITANGGTAPYTFAVTSGNLPGGLSLASDGTLSGIPGATGTFNFTITATYTTFGINCSGSRVYTVVIAACGSTRTFTVNSTGDASDETPGNGICATPGGVCTLRAAIEEINALSACNNIINFSTTGTISMSAIGDTRYGPSAMGVDRKITINGNGITLERNSSVTRLRLFYVSPFGDLTLNDVTLKNGKALGGNGGTGGTGGGGGAGLGGAIFNEGTLAINRSTLTSNSAQGGNGGATSSGSSGSGGGGMGGDGSGGSTNGGDGGGPNGGTGAAVDGVGGAGGNGGGGGGGKGVTFVTATGGAGGFGGGGGGGGSNSHGGNGGFGAGGGTGNNTAGGGNESGGFGGGNGGGNTTAGGGAGMGGALFNNYQGIVTITNSTFFGNTVTAGTGVSNGNALGSGLFNRNGNVSIISSTFNDAVYNLGASNTDISGGTARTGGTMTLFSTIISTCNNNGGTVVGPLANRNLIQNNSGCDTPYLTGDPNFSALQNNGGLTQTLMLLQPSIAIDAGDNSVLSSPYSLTTDQTGKPRQANGTVDIGAFESQLILNPATFPNAQVGTPFSQTITATGGTSPYTFTVTGGTLPSGLTLSSGGVLSGNPSPAGGPFTFEVTATDNTGKKGGRLYNTITICGTITANPSSMSDATLGTGYTQTLTGTGGTAPYTFAITSGTLPNGMFLTPQGVLQGSPVSTGTANFTVTITDVNGCAGTKAYSLNVNSNPCATTAITVTANGDSGPGTLRQAIADICGGGTITIQPGLGTINLSTVGDNSFGPTALAILNKAVTINGNGVIIQRDNSVSNLRLFYINATGNLQLQNVTIQNGMANGGNGAGSGAGGAGMGGAIVNQGYLEIKNSTLSSNKALGGNGSTGGGGGGGGGMGFSGGTGGNGGGGGGGRSGVGSNSTSNGGTGGLPSGGGGQNGTNGAGGFTGGTGNTGGGGGGAGNSAGRAGGNGGAGGFGGGGGGGGGNGFGSPVGNGGDGGFGGGGGGGGTAFGQNGTGGDGGFGGGGGGGGTIGTGGFAGGIGSNSAGGGGGGLGGAVFNHLGTVKLINSTFSGNTAQGGNGTGGSVGGSGYGGGVFNYNGFLTTVGVTFSDNNVIAGTNGTPSSAGGGIYNLGDASTATLSMINSILANTANGALDCSCSTLNGGTNSVTGNNNLIENNSGCGTTALTSDPNLGALADNGGFTLTHALQTGSPAIDAGDNSVINAPYSLTTDQRGTGFARQYGGTVDIGAFESQVINSSPTVTAQTGISRQQGSAGSDTQIATVNDSETSPGSLTVTATTVPAGITVTSITNSNGTISATVAANCNATVGANIVVLTVTDGGGLTATANLTVDVTANIAPVLTYGNTSVNAGSAATVSPATGPSDNGSISTIVLQSVSPATAPATLTVDNVTGVVTVPGNVPVGTYTVTIRATDNCGSTTDAIFTLAVQTADYTITTAGNIVTITDVSGNGETMDISQSGGNIRFNVTGRTYSINGGAITPFTTPADVALAGITSIVVNTAAGNDIINVAAFLANLPSLTVNGGVGDDQVNFNGDIIFAGNANLDVDLQNDDVTPGTDLVTFAGNANLILSGTGIATVKVSQNVTFNSGSSLETANGDLTIETNQQATATTGSFAGVNIAGGGIWVTGTGNLLVKGKGGNSGSNQYGVFVLSLGLISGGSGTVTVQGTGGASVANGNYGVFVSGTNAQITSTGGNVSVTGQGGGAGTSIQNFGVHLDTGGQVTAGGSGTVTVEGTGGATSGNINIGVYINGTGSKITSTEGNVSVTGQGGGTGTSQQNYGVLIQSVSQITAGGSGTVTVQGTGGAASGNSNVGVILNGNGSKITSNGGNVIVTGLGGGTGTSGANSGVSLTSAGQITAGNSGTVTVQGTGGTGSGNGNAGVEINGTNSRITSNGANVIVTGIEGTGGTGIVINSNGSSITTADNGGHLTLIANSMNLAGTVSTQASGSTTLYPYTNNVSINLGTATDAIGGPLNLSDTELDQITTGTLIIGNANSGTITVSTDITRPASTNVQLLSGGDVNISGGGFNTGGGTLLLDPGNSPAAVKPTFNGTDATASTLSFGSDLQIIINGTVTGDGTGSTYNQLKVAGAIDLTGVDLLFTGSYTPVASNTFIIVDNDDADAVTGTFTGLAEGAIISNFRGSSLNATISYVGGDGNDVAIIVQCPAIPTPTVGTITQPTCAVATGSVILNNLPASGTWTLNPGNISGTGTSTTVSNLTAGTTYNFTVTNAEGCVSGFGECGHQCSTLAHPLLRQWVPSRNPPARSLPAAWYSTTCRLPHVGAQSGEYFGNRHKYHRNGISGSQICQFHCHQRGGLRLGRFGECGHQRSTQHTHCSDGRYHYAAHLCGRYRSVVLNKSVGPPYLDAQSGNISGTGNKYHRNGISGSHLQFHCHQRGGLCLSGFGQCRHQCPTQHTGCSDGGYHYAAHSSAVATGSVILNNLLLPQFLTINPGIFREQAQVPPCLI